VIVVQRTASDLKLNPHLHVVFLDGVFLEHGEEAAFHALPHLQTREVADVLERTCKRMAKWLRRRGLLLEEAGRDDDASGVGALAASAASGQTPPAGPEWRRGALPLVRAALAFDKPLCASLDGFTLHAATRAGALDAEGREALLKYILRPPVAQERVTHGPDGLVRITLKKPFADGTVAVDGAAEASPAQLRGPTLPPLSLGCVRTRAAIQHGPVCGSPRRQRQAPPAYRAEGGLPAEHGRCAGRVSAQARRLPLSPVGRIAQADFFGGRSRL
jgi:hypothetical protein